MEASKTQACPSCGAAVPVFEGYVGWCHACGWNLQAPQRERPASRLDRLYERAGRRLGERMFATLAASERLEPRLTGARIAAYVVAVLVYALTVGLVAGGIALVILTFPNPFVIALAVVMVGAGVLMHPRPVQAPEEGMIEQRRVPALTALIVEIARALGVPPPDILVVDHSFNASWNAVGLRRRTVLTLGLPLFAALTPQQRVALIAHELAHGRNGDVTRTFLVGSAVRGLGELYSLLAPKESWEMEGDLVERVVNPFFWVSSRPALWLLLLELHLLLRDSQRAEYLADALAASAAGTDAVVALHETALLESTAQGVIRSVAHHDEANPFAELARAFAAVPERERERRHRVARLETTRLEATHPPTALRIRLLEDRAHVEPAVQLDEQRSARIDDELSFLYRSLTRRLVDEYRDSLYY